MARVDSSDPKVRASARRVVAHNAQDLDEEYRILDMLDLLA
jgi:hypothetical protein